MNYLNFVKSNKYLLLFGFLCVFIGNLGQTFFISLFNKDLISNLLLEKDNLSLVYSIATLISGFTIFFVGAKIDDIEVKKFTIIVITGLIASCLLFANSNTLFMLFFSYLGIRLCGQGLMTHIAVTTLMRYIPQHRGKAVSLALQGMAFGEMVMPAIAVNLLKNHGHTASWHGYALFALLLVFPLMMWLLKKADLVPVHKTSGGADEESMTKDWSRSQVMSDWRFWLILPAIIGPAFLITGIFFHQTLLIDGKGWSMEWLSYGLMLYGFIHFLGAVLTGPLVDKSHPRVYMRWYLLPLVLGMICLYVGQTETWLLAFMFLAGLTVASSGPVINSFYADVFGSTHLGAIRALVSATMIISTGVAPYLFSLFDTIGSFLTFAIGYGVIASLIIQKKLLAEKS
ncbi:MFS transporter [Kangiella sediminilitoris]|uniref:Major facilitator superfamily MFS_1 n=1 Tax=Kangiella sediminilitoris TaxID=1144748 RepID=A0A1B3B8N2_9GAMM|nr:MFS transporter [Kangiella sediminilitoris]AOE49131.1 Major facilitator superfamily MFS_1 [Kangiella sediminilitoris]